MIIIADTSPLSALAEIGALDVLPALYGTITVPETVKRECLHPQAPTDLAPFFASAAWLVVTPDPIVLLPEAAGLDPGEAAAISLASQYHGDVLLIIDDLTDGNFAGL